MDVIIGNTGAIEHKSLYPESQNPKQSDDDILDEVDSINSDTRSLDMNPRSGSPDLKDDANSSFILDNDSRLVRAPPKKIFLISHYLDYSGAPQVLYLLYNYLKETGYDVCLISQRPVGLDLRHNKLIPPNYVIRPQNLIKFINRECLGVSADPSTSIDKPEYQPVIFCNTLLTHVYVKEALKHDLPTYWIIHESIKPYSKLVKKHIIHLMPRVTGMIYVCEASRSAYSKIKQNRAEVIYNSLNLEKMDARIEAAKNYRVPIPNGSLLTREEFLNFRTLKGREKLKKLQELTNKKELWEKACSTIGPITGPSRVFLEERLESKKNNIIIITIVGLICDNKNQMGFIEEVFEPLSKQFDNLRLLLLGNIADELLGKTIKHDKVIYQGLVDNVIPYLLISDIVVCYSKFEVFPMSLLEAMYCEKPIVSVYRGGIGEMIENGNNGFLIKNGEQALNRLTILINDEEKRKLMGKRSIEIVRDLFSLQSNFSKYIEIIDPRMNISNQGYIGILD